MANTVFVSFPPSSPHL